MDCNAHRHPPTVFRCSRSDDERSGADRIEKRTPRGGYWPAVYRPDHHRHLHARFCLAQHGLCAPTQTGITQPLHRIRSASRVYRFCVCTHDCRSIHSRSRMPDGAGAVVLQASEQAGVISSALHADGRHTDILCAPGRVSGGAICGQAFVTMDGQAVFKLAVHLLEKVALEALDKARMSAAQIDWLIPHQANIRIMQGTCRKLGLPLERMLVTVDQHGNTSSASIPLALDEAVRDGRIARGHTIMIEGVGGGLTWGAAVIRF